MYNIRYHLASLVSIFLALALGLVLGGLIVGNTSAPDQSALADSLKEEFGQIREDNQKVRTENANLSAYALGVTDELVANQLTGYSVMILGSKSKTSSTAAKAIQRAGATTYAVTFNSANLDLEDSTRESTKLVEELMAKVQSKDPLKVLSAGLVDEWSSLSTTNRPLTTALVAEGVIAIPNPDKSYGVVLGALNTLANEGVVDPLGLSLSAAFAEKGLAVAGVSLSGEDDVLAIESWNSNLIGINTLGTPIGTYSVVAALKGAPVGLYGTSNNAIALYPAMPEVLEFAGQNNTHERLDEKQP